MVPESDELIIHKIIAGDTGSFGQLVDRYQHQIYNLALRMVNHTEDARDITQETFIKAFRSLPDFKFQSGFRSWIHRIAANTCLDHLRRRSRDSAFKAERPPDFAGDLVENLPAPEPGPEERLIRSERQSAVKKALEMLPEAYRLPLVMQHYQGLSYREIAGALEMPEKTVATRLYRAKMMLREWLLGGDNGEVRTGENKAGGSFGRGVQAL